MGPGHLSLAVVRCELATTEQRVESSSGIEHRPFAVRPDGRRRADVPIARKSILALDGYDGSAMGAVADLLVLVVRLDLEAELAAVDL
jgi:hypothetical protein